MSENDVTVIDGNTGQIEMRNFRETLGREDLTQDQFDRLEAHVDAHHSADWGKYEDQCHAPEGLIIDGTIE